MDALYFIESHHLALGTKVLLVGDSNLVISFMMRCYRLSKLELKERIQWARAITARLQGIRVDFCHMKWDRNAWADWLGWCADTAQRDVCLEDLVSELPRGERPPSEVCVPEPDLSAHTFDVPGATTPGP